MSDIVKNSNPILLDSQQFLEMTRRYYGQIYYTALSIIKDPETAQDIAQETFLRAWLKRDAVRDPASQLQPWLGRIARNLAIQWLRQGQRRSRLIPVISMEEATVDPIDSRQLNPRDEVAGIEASNQVAEAIMNLPDDLRQTVLLHYAEGMSPADVARLNDEARSTVTRRLDKARKLLKKYLGDSPAMANGLASLKPGKSSLEKTLATLTVLMAMPVASQAGLLNLAADTLPPPAFKGGKLPNSSLLDRTQLPTGSAKTGVLKGIVATCLVIAAVATCVYQSGAQHWKDRLSSLWTGPATQTVKGPAIYINHPAKQGSDSKSRLRHRGMASGSAIPAPSAELKKPSAYGPLPASDKLAEITGKVIDGAGSPVAGARVKGISREGMVRNVLEKAGSVQTAADGSFRLPNVPPGSFGLYIIPPDHAPIADTISAPVSDVVVTVKDPGARFAGVVINEETGNPVSGTTVSIALGQSTWPIDDPIIVTGSDGKFEFNHVPAGEYYLRAEADGLGMRSEKPGLFSSAPVKTYTLESGDSIDDIKIRMYKGHTVTGIVRDSTTGKPLPGVTVDHRDFYLENPLASVVTDASGRYRMDHVTGASGFLVWFGLHKPGYIHTAKSQRGEENSPMFEVGDDSEIIRDFVMVPSVALRGVVTDESRQPVAGALVLFNSQTADGRVNTDTSGRFQLDLLPDSDVALSVTNRGRAAYRQQLKVDHTPIELDVVMPTGKTGAGVVLDASGIPLEGAIVEAYRSAHQAGNTTFGDRQRVGQTLTDHNGRFAITNLPSEVISFIARKTDYAEAATSVKIEDSEVSDEAVIQLKGGKDIYGIVTDKNGNPVDGAEVKIAAFQVTPQQYITTKTSADGTFWFASLPDRAVSLSATHPKWGKVNAKDVIQPGGDDVELVFGGPESPRALEVHVLDGITQAPVKDFKILSSYGQSPITPEIPGVFVHPEITPGQTVKYVIQAPGYALLNTGFITSPDYKSTPSLTLLMGQGGTVKGQLEAPQGTTFSLQGLKITVKSPVASVPDYTALSDADGTFQIKQIPAGESILTVTGSTVMGELQREIEVAEGRVLDLGRLPLSVGTVLRGRVVNSQGNAVPDVEIEVGELNKTPQKTTTEPDGYYEISGLGHLDYWMEIPQYNISSHLRIGPGEPHVNRDFVIGGSTIKGKVIMDGFPASNVQVNAHDGTSSRQAKTDNEGQFSINGLVGGKYGLSASSGSRGGRLPVSIQDGQTTEVTLDINSGNLTGKLLDAQGKPVGGADMIIQNRVRWTGLTASYGVTTRGDGTFDWDSLPAGTYDVAARKNEQFISSVKAVEVPPNGVTSGFEIRLPERTGGVDISMKHADGTPVIDAAVEVSIPLVSRHKFKEKIDANGLLALRDLPPGSYRIEITPAGQKQSTTHDVKIDPGAITRVEEVIP